MTSSTTILITNSLFPEKFDEFISNRIEDLKRLEQWNHAHKASVEKSEKIKRSEKGYSETPEDTAEEENEKYFNFISDDDDQENKEFNFETPKEDID
jgi:hypothetical protein